MMKKWKRKVKEKEDNKINELYNKVLIDSNHIE